MTIDDYKKDPWVLIIVKYNNNYIMYLLANTRKLRDKVLIAMNVYQVQSFVNVTTYQQVFKFFWER